MSIANEDVAKFYSWAKSFAISQTQLPNINALETILKSSQRDLFMNILEIVKPKDQVRRIRKSILVDKINKTNNECIVQISEKYLPDECKKSLKLSKLKAEKKALEASIENYKESSKTLLNDIHNKNMQNTKLEKVIKDLRVRINLFEIKTDSLEKQLEYESSIKKKINKSMPVRIKNSNVDSEKAAELVNELITMLETFYKDYDTNSNIHLVKDLQANLWHQLQQIINKMPTYTIFNTVLKLTEDQIQNVLSLKNNITTLSNDSNSSSSELTDMEKQVLRSQMSIFVNTAKLASVKRAYTINFNKFTEGFHNFVDSVKTRVDMFNNSLNSVDDYETIVSDYITQYNTITYKRAQNEDLRKEIDICKMKFEENKKHIDNDSLVLLTLKDIYENIQNIADKIVYDISGMNQVKDKIMFWKNTIAGEFISIKQKSNRLQTSLMNSSIGISNRMDITNSCLDLTTEQGGVFSSTKVDFDATLSVTMQRFGDISMLPQKRFTMPNHVIEVKTFTEIPISSFYNITKEDLYYIHSNDSHRDDLKNAFPSVLTNSGIVNELRWLRNWSEDVNLLLKAQIPQIHYSLGKP
ncbi:hypothetical protein ACFFRR_000728 [Megaselia abdita]